MIERLVGDRSASKLGLASKPGTYHVELCAIAKLVRSEGESDRLALVPVQLQQTMPDRAAQSAP